MHYNAIEVDHVSKVFKRQSGAPRTFLERFLSVGRGAQEQFNALDDVSFDVRAGETLGVLGHNGSGKSTLLKCITGTIRPTEGTIGVRGTLSALLELGAGFHPDLTGRENVYLNGSILGFSKDDIDELMNDIIDFSEIPAFIDTQVKHYSSGMFARLGFAVAVNLKPDVLLIDEVLAVGDEAFQRKCLERIRKFQDDGRTIVIVTHSADMVRLFCSKAVVLDSGKMIFDGDPADGVTVYREALERRTGVRPGDGYGGSGSAKAIGPVSLATVELVDSDDDVFQAGDPLALRVGFVVNEALDDLRVRVWMHSHDGILMNNVSTFDAAGEDLGAIEPGPGSVTFRFADLPMHKGAFELTVALQSPDEEVEYDRVREPVGFSVESGDTALGRLRIPTTVELDLPVSAATAPTA